MERRSGRTAVGAGWDSGSKRSVEGVRGWARRRRGKRGGGVYLEMRLGLRKLDGRMGLGRHIHDLLAVGAAAVGLERSSPYTCSVVLSLGSQGVRW